MLEHSLLLMHSGRQFGGSPMKSYKQEQDGILFVSLHKELGPQGDGTHGFTSSVNSGSSNKNIHT